MTEKEKALLEAAAWSLRGPDVREDKRDWVSKLLGIRTGEIEKRSKIISAGDAGDPIWEALEIDLSFHAAGTLLLEAKALANRKRIPLREAVEVVLEHYQCQPVTRYLPNNKVARGRGATSARKVVRDLSEEEVPPIDVKAVVEEKNFWSSIRKQFSEYADRRLVGFDGIERAEVKRDFEQELRTILESLRVKIHLRTSRRKARISFAEVANACLTLAMDPPSRGELPNLVVAKSRKRALAKEYHSDLSGTSDTTENLNAVLKAFELIEAYCKQMKMSEMQGNLRNTEGNSNGGDNE